MAATTGFGKSICFQAPSNSNLFIDNVPFDGGRHLLRSQEKLLLALSGYLPSFSLVTIAIR